MADKGYVKTLINGIPEERSRQLIASAFDEVLDNFRVGPIEHAKRATNGQSYFFQAVTAAVSSGEFTIRHGQGQTPLWLRPILPLDSVNVTMPAVTVTRAADETRIYLKSPSTGITFFVEVGF